MKKIALCLMAVCLSLAFYPIQSEAATATAPSKSVVSIPAQKIYANVLLRRLNDIKEMDKSNLKPSEKKNLRVEVRSIRQQLNELGGGVYLSAVAIIIILLVLIILL